MRIKETLKIVGDDPFYRNVNNTVSICYGFVKKMLGELCDCSEICIVLSDKRIHCKNCHVIEFSDLVAKIDGDFENTVVMHIRLVNYLRYKGVVVSSCHYNAMTGENTYKFSKPYYFVLAAVEKKSK